MPARVLGVGGNGREWDRTRIGRSARSRSSRKFVDQQPDPPLQTLEGGVLPEPPLEILAIILVITPEMDGGRLELLGVGSRRDGIGACQVIMRLSLPLLDLIGVFQAAPGHPQGLVNLALLQ